MKKRLLSVAFALLATATSFAYQIGEYAYNSTQRFKITGENIVQNGNFANGLTGWHGAEAGTAPSVEIWDAGAGVGAGPNGENAIVSLGASADAPLCNSWALNAGTYVVSFDFYATTAGNTSNTVFFLTTGDSFTAGDGDVTVSGSFNYPAEEWKSVVFFFTAEAGQSLVMNFKNLVADTKITNIEIHEATEVYDVRIAQRRLAYAKELMENEHFNVPAAAGERANLAGIIEAIEGMIESGEMDDANQATEMLNSFTQEGLEPYLSVTSDNIAQEAYFKYVENLTTFPKYNRGQIADGQVIGGFKFYGGNWLHGDKTDFLNKQIQGTYDNGAGTVVLRNENLPAGKYFVSAEMRNAYCDKNYAYTFNLESAVKARIGSEEKELGTIVGEDFVRFFMVGEVKEGEVFEAGFWWDGPATGSSFQIKNFEVRTFDKDMAAKEAHQAAFKAYMAQWNAATNNRTALTNLLGNPNYPWGQTDAKEAYNKWNGFYTAQEAKGWSTADGEDAGIASTDELNDWALYQGVEEYDTDEEGNQTRKTYQVVRGFQNATNALKTVNKPLTDLADAIVIAKSSRNNAANLTGDREAYKTAILAALATLNDVRSTTTDATYAADSTKAADALVALNAASEAFLASVTNKPIVDIDFANLAVENDFSGDHDEAYYIEGAAGRLYSNNYEADNNTNAVFTQGYIEEYMDVLRIGNGSATVYIDEADQPTGNEAVRVAFDIWFGKLINKYTGIELQNAAGERIAGFSYDCYNAAVAYNDFNDAENTGMDIPSWTTAIGKGGEDNSLIYTTSTNKSSFDLVINYANKTLTGGIVNGKQGNHEGAAMPFRTDITDQKVAKFVIKCDYNNKDRRCWFDNLKISKFATSDVEEDITENPWLDYTPDGIQNVTNNAAAPAGIYTINGVKVSKATKPGLYIINGKKVVIK